MYKYIYSKKNPFYLDLPVKSLKICLFSGLIIGKSISTPLTLNNLFNFESVTVKF